MLTDLQGTLFEMLAECRTDVELRQLEDTIEKLELWLAMHWAAPWN